MTTKETQSEVITEAHISVIKEVALNEILNFFQNKARTFNNQSRNVAFVEPAKKGQVVRNPKLFDGTIYTDHTHLPPQRWSLFKKKTPVPRRGGIITKGFNLVFIIGYSLDINDIFYEVWFDSATSSYSVLDKYAIPVSSTFKNLDDAMNDFINIVSEDLPTVHKGELSGKEQALLRSLARRGTFGVDEAIDQAEEKALVEELLEATGVTRKVLTQMLNDQVTEYHTTHMNSRTIKKFWQFWEKNVQLPSNYISHGFIGAVQKFVGRKKTATFIVGFSLKNQIDVEIFYVKNNATATGSYYIFDLTSGEIVAQDLKTLRQAYAAAGKKILVPTALYGKIE